MAKVNLVGKEYVSGTSRKTGKPFEMWVAYIEYPDRHVEGVKCENIVLNASIPSADLVVGATYELSYNKRGYVDNFSICK